MPARPVTPYSADLGDRDPLEAIAGATSRIEALTAAWAPAEFDRAYAPGKWTVRQVLVHLAQCELAFGVRVRMALTTPGYVTQNMDQDAWMAWDRTLGGAEAAQAFAALSRMNLALFTSLSAAERATTLSHPEYGALTVDWIVHQTAGHQLHHLAQLEPISRR